MAEDSNTDAVIYYPVSVAFASRAKFPIHPIPLSVPLIRNNYSHFPLQRELDHAVAFNSDRHLVFPYMFSGPAYYAAQRIEVDDDSILQQALVQFRVLCETGLPHQAARTLLQNCARSILFVHRARQAGLLDQVAFVTLAVELAQVFEQTREAWNELPADVDLHTTPPSFVTVSELLWKIIANTTLDAYLVCTFVPNRPDLALRIPIVIHPHLDLSMEGLQLSLQKIIRATCHQHTQVAAHVFTIRAFGVVNASLFVNPCDVGRKADAFEGLVTEFRTLHSRTSALDGSTKSAWLACTLVAPNWLDEFRQLCIYMQEGANRITGETCNLDIGKVEAAIEADAEAVGALWRANLAAAADDKCTNIDTCEAIIDFPQWVMKNIRDLGDIEGGTLAAERAWKVLQGEEAGTYGHRALMFAMYELRRNITPSLQEWEFLEHEVSLQAPLGYGGFADVYRCAWLGGVAAVKVYKPKPSEGRSAFTLTPQHFDTYLHQREMEAWFRLSHPHILPFLGACATSPTPMILTPLAPNGTARSYRAAYPDADWVKMLTQASSGVHYLHKTAGIVHGDIKGANILIDANGSPMISDFGLAKMVQNLYGRINRGGGTAQWMSPELLSGGQLSYASDVYALAMTIYELWFDKDPFDYMESDLVQEMVVEEEMRPTREDDPPMPDDMWELLEACWVADPAIRPTSHEVSRRMKIINGEDIDDDGLVSPITPSQERPNEGADDQPQDASLEGLPCSALHHNPSKPKRPDFPFVSAGHLISFAIRSRPVHYRKSGGETLLETTPDAIRSGGTAHPVQKIIFRIQNDTKRIETFPNGIPYWWGPDTMASPSRFHATLLRPWVSQGQAHGEWEEVPEARDILLLDGVAACNATLVHEISLDGGSPIVQHAAHGDKVGLRVAVDTNWEIDILWAEIEMRVKLDT